MTGITVDQRVSELTQEKDVIVFDSVCILCSGFMRFVVAHDTNVRFSFVTAQSNRGEALYEHLGLKEEDYSTNLVVVDGQVFTKMDAFLAVVPALGWPWKAALVLKAVPTLIGNWFYDRIARNRYAVFGRTEQCLIPGPELSARFLD